MKDIVLKALDILEVGAKTLLSTIPIGGALISSVYDSVKGNCLAKRQQKWQAIVEDRLSKMEISLERIGNNEMFTTTLIKATELAMKTADEAKIQYLANAVANSEVTNLSEERLIIFLDMLDKYTSSHMKIIDFFNNPKKYSQIADANYMMGSPKTPLFAAYPELNNPLFEKIYKDLFLDGLVNTENLNATMTGNGMIAKRTTELGDEFLEFILAKK